MSEQIYEHLDIKMQYCEIPQGYDNYILDFSIPIVLFGFAKSKVYYYYSYRIFDDDGRIMAGCSRVGAVATIEFKNGKFEITKYFEEA